MRSTAILVGASLAALGAAPAAACWPVFGTFKERMAGAELAVRARASSQFTERWGERLVGTVVLDVHECLRRAKRVRRCPRRIVVQVDEYMDGVNCPPEVVQLAAGDSLNFFLLGREGERGWQIGVARREFDE